MTKKITSNQRKQILQFVEDGINAMDTQKDDAQRLIENEDEFKRELKKFVERFSTNQYADEEVKSNYGYPSDYTPKGITEQTNLLRALFPGIGDANEKLAEAGLPENAEGWFAIPQWQKVAPTYGGALEKVLNLIRQTRNGAFHNYYPGPLYPYQLRQSEKAKSMFQMLSDEQKDQDILVVPAQFGIRHRGRSVRRARSLMNANECGLGAFAIGIMLLTNPERLQRFDDLWIDCAGDDLAPTAYGDFSLSPCFNFIEGYTGFGGSKLAIGLGDRGSASVCLPQG